MDIQYRHDIKPDIDLIIDVYKSSGINRPINDIERMKNMFNHSNLIITAWDKNLLVGVSRSLTDYSYCCYLSDLAVRKEYQMQGIGKKLIEITKELIGKQSSLILLSAPTAMDYYPKIGMQNIDNGFMIKRIE